MSEKLGSDIAVRRLKDGKFLYARRGVMLESETPKFISTVDRAMMAVRIDMGLSLSDVEFVTRASLREKRQ
ncbi:hypothetical protein [Devosia sp. Naph2]|uniref:hypothetical protein n=1 Tax=Devosia polycyclovorans TaxID=3345148 RepID=UPI0035CFA051